MKISGASKCTGIAKCKFSRFRITNILGGIYNGKKVNKKAYIGIIYTVLISAVFIAVSLIGLNLLTNNWIWYTYSSVIRVLFGIFAVWLMCKIFNKKVCDIINTKNTGLALIAGLGFCVYFIYYLVVWVSGFQGFYGLSISLIISQIFLQQITTGFYEEIIYRGLVLEGYFEQEKKTKAMRLIYGLTSFILFGMIHVITSFDLGTFLRTSVIGFAFAAIYLVSHNILIPMLLHFIYDIFANLAGYMHFRDSEILSVLNTIGFDMMYIVMFLISLVIILKMPNKQSEVIK